MDARPAGAAAQEPLRPAPLHRLRVCRARPPQRRDPVPRRRVFLVYCDTTGTLASCSFLTAFPRTTPAGALLRGALSFDHTRARLEATALLGQTVTTGQLVPA